MRTAGLMALPVFLPVAAGLLISLVKPLRRKTPRRWFLVAALVLSLLAALAVAAFAQGELVLLPLAERLVIVLRADGLGKFFSILASVMFLLAGVFSIPYMEHEGDENSFYRWYLLVLGFLNGIGLSGNLLTLYLFFEVMTLFSMPMVLHSRTREAVSAAFRYLFYSIAGASMALVALFYVYAGGAALDFVPGGIQELESGAPLLAVSMLAIVGFGAKAGMFPLHAWLPTAHPVAPAPASAVLSGVITKAGVFAVIRYVFYIVGADRLRDTWVQTVWMILALVTVFMGSTLAYREPVLKKRMAFSSVSQVSYIMFGLATLSPQGVLGGLLHIVFHSIAKNAFFLLAGLIILYTGKTLVSELEGIGKSLPAPMACFALVSVTMVGIPPTSGFLSKWYLATGAMGAEIGVFRWLGPALLLFSALLTAGYLFPIPIRAFFPAGPDTLPPQQRIRVSPAMSVPIGILTFCAVAFGLYPAPLLAFFRGIVASFL